MTTIDEGEGQPARKIRADAQRNEQALLAYFLDRLVPVCAQLLPAAEAGEIRADIDALELMYASATSALVPTMTRATMPAAWSSCSSRDSSNRARPDTADPEKEHLQYLDKVGQLRHSAGDVERGRWASAATRISSTTACPRQPPKTARDGW